MAKRRWGLTMVLLCAGGIRATAAPLTADDLKAIFTHAADRAAEVDANAVIAIVDRDARVLLVRHAVGNAAVTAAERAIAVAKAGTAVFLSSNAEAFTSRTAGYIVQQNFPPGILNRPPGPLVGVEFSSLAFSDINYFRELDGSRVPGTRLNGSPGGVPLYKDEVLVAGLGVTGDGTEQEDASITGSDPDEAVALAGQIGYAPDPQIRATNVFIDGISLPYVESEAKAAATPSGTAFDPTGVSVPATVTWPTDLIGGVVGEVRAPIRSDPIAGAIDGQARLTADEVRTIITNAAARTLVTRGGIRLPRGQPAAVFITVVNNPNQAGVPAAVLGTFRTPDATVFSWDVAIQKARTAVFFSSNTRSFSTRTVGFLAQAMYPPGLANEPAGPFNGLQERFSLPLLTGTAGANPNLPNGITIFPGGFPLYRNGVLIGAIGVSGDGVDQDDLIAASGTVGFQPSSAIRADNMSYLNARLPYAKFPRDAELRPNVDPILSLPAGFQAPDADPDATGGLANISTFSTSDNGVTNGQANASAALLPYPVSIALDNSATLYVGDGSTDLIRKVTPAGVITTVAGTSGQIGSADGAGSAARFNDPSGLAAAGDGTLSVADTGNGTIRRITPAGIVATLAGSASSRGNTDGTGAAATFSAPIGVAQDGNGVLYVADATNNTVRRIDTGGGVTTLAGAAGVAGTADGAGGVARFNHPTGAAVDAAGNVYVTDSTNNTLRKISSSGVVTTLAGVAGVVGGTDGTGADALFNNPTGVAVDGAGAIYVADTGNSAIRKVSPAGVVTTLAGLPGIAGLQNGTGAEAWFNQPRALALDPSGNVYVADTGNAAVRKVTPAGVVTTLVLSDGSATSGGNGSGSGSGSSSSSGSGGGGGGAPSEWFLGALASVCLLRWLRRK